VTHVLVSRPSTGVPAPGGRAKDETVKYDDSEWHRAEARKAQHPENAGTHIAMFLAWVLANRLDARLEIGAPTDTASSEALDEANERDDVRSRRRTASELLHRWWDEKLFSTDLTREGAAFANGYYRKQYLDDYEQTLSKGLRSFYAVPDTWESFDKLAPVLDHRFREWQAKHVREKSP
jgi:hypothetical protein